MKDDPNLFEKVQTVLMSDWDPIGVQDVPEAQDEYDPYIRPIMDLLWESAPVKDVAFHLKLIQCYTMGLNKNNDLAEKKAFEVAEKLSNLV